MHKLSILLSLITTDNDYQHEEAVAAEDAARRLGVDLKIIFAQSDAITQSQQLLEIIQSDGPRPDGIILEPVSNTGLPQVARAAVAAGIAWGAVNQKVEYIPSLQKMSQVPVFQVSADHVQAGRIQGQQLKALLPQGGLVLFIQGPSSATTAVDRTKGMNETRPSNIQLRSMKGAWTQESADAVISSWLRLSTSHTLPVQAIVAQNDAMAMGARRALERETKGDERSRWLSLPFIGCDGLQQTGKVWVRSKVLAATTIIPTTTGQAIEMLVDALRNGKRPAETTMVPPVSYPPVEQLVPVRSR